LPPPVKPLPTFAMEDPLQQCISRHRTEAAWDSQQGAYVTSDAHGGRLFTRYVGGVGGLGLECHLRKRATLSFLLLLSPLYSVIHPL